ncbi:MAG: pseudouridine synthase [Cyclobacteriaceae bacterium]|nr:pseudouridine synthase [Cyclobacteriaceae bacterium]
MARNSRFRTTSGPSSGRPRPDKKKSFKGDDEKRSFRPDGKSGDSNPRYGKRPFKKGDGSFDKKGPFREKRGGDERPFKKGPFESRGGDARPFKKEPWREKRSERPGGPGRSDDRDSRYTRSKDDRRDSGRGSKPFSKSDFTKRAPDGERREGSYDRKKTSFDRKKGGSDHGKSGYRGENRRAFDSSRMEPHEGKKSGAAGEKPKDGLIRLNRFISNSGVCSRREADDLITMGLITVNGKSVTELGFKVKPTDDVRYDGRRLVSEKPVYILLNKPKGYITTTDDPQERNTVMQLIHGACKERVYPVGRLDRNTSGLLLLTNDGDLTDKLTHPSYNVKKIYKAELNKPLTKADFQKVLDGVRLEEGKAMVDDLAIVSDDGMTVGIEIHIGWNRVIRRIFEALGYEVVKLDRSVYATLDKKDLSRGHWRFLRQDEIIRLKHFQ